MAIFQQKERIDERIDAIYQALKDAFDGGGNYSEMEVTRSYTGLVEQSDVNLDKGVIMILCDAESNYSDRLGMVAKNGSLDLMIICHLRVAEGTARSAIEDREIAVVEELKTFFRAGLPGISFEVDRFTFSGQRYHPLGFVAGKVSAVPPRSLKEGS